MYTVLWSLFTIRYFILELERVFEIFTIDHMFKKHVYLIVVAVLSMSLVTTGSGCDRQRDKARKVIHRPVPVKISTAKAEQRTRHLEYTGSAAPWDKVILNFKVAGRITKMAVREGDYVKKGRTIARIDPTDYTLMRRLAQVQVDSLKKELGRVRRLTEKGAIPGAQLDRIQARYDAALTQLERAGRVVRETTLKSPASGILLKKMVSVGDLVAPQRPVGVLGDLSKLRINVSVPEHELRYFRRGMKVPLEVPALSLKLEGEVYEIAYIPEEKTRTYRVTISASNVMRDGVYRVRAGMLVRFRIPADPIKGIFVPMRTILLDPSSRPFVYVVEKSGLAQRKFVHIGEIFGEEVRVTGLTEGDKLVTGGAQFLYQGAPVRLVK